MYACTCIYYPQSEARLPSSTKEHYYASTTVNVCDIPQYIIVSPYTYIIYTGAANRTETPR